MAYLFLGLGIVCEIFGTTMLKASEGFTKPIPAAGGLLGFGLALFFVSLAFKSIPLSIAYATWCGVGIAGASLIGYLVWGEKITLTGFFGILLITIGIVLLVVAPASQETTQSVQDEQTVTMK